jgi:hypothetical protein
MTGTGQTDRPTKATGLIDGEVVDGLMVLQDGTDRVHHLNPSAAVIFELCDGVRTVQDIAAEVAELYGLDAAPVDETVACHAHLREEGLVHPA